MNELKNPENPKKRGWSSWSAVRRDWLFGALAGCFITIGIYLYLLLNPPQSLLDSSGVLWQWVVTPAVLIMKLFGKSASWFLNHSTSVSALPAYILVLIVNSVLGGLIGVVIGKLLRPAKTDRRYSMLFMVCAWATISHSCYGHDWQVHKSVTANAFNYSSALQAFLDNNLESQLLTASPPQESGTFSPTKWLQLGSRMEDEETYSLFFKQRPEQRTLDHFYTVLPNRAAGQVIGLTDFSESTLEKLGTLTTTVNSFIWTTQDGIEGPGTVGVNVYKWSDARNYERLALTSASGSDRDENMALMLYTLGHVLHLNQDLSQPDHVRDDAHHLKAWIEDYGLAYYELYPQWFTLPPNATVGWANWQAQGFNKLLDFWDRGKYIGGSSAGLVADANGDAGAKLGLAEFSNGNFLGEDAIYTEVVPQSDPYHHFPFPSLYHSTDYNTVRNNILTGVAGGFTKDGQPAQFVYLKKIADGIPVTHHSVLGYLDVMTMPAADVITRTIDIQTPSIDDDMVLQDYHSIVLPKAVEYSTGILDYFFRGTLDVTVVGQSGGTYSLKIKNTSGQDFKDGSFHLFYDDASGNRAEITGFSTTYSGALLSGSSTSGSFSAPAGASKYILVYQGTIGTTGGQASDPVDAGIAIATQSFPPPVSVQISLYGQVMLPDYYPDESFAYADLALYADTVELTDLHIVSDNYYDPDDCFYYGINCDTCGVASGYPSSANIEMDCGKTYDFILQGNACDVTGAFSLLPAGYMMEWQLTPSGPVEDNKSSQQIYSVDYDDFKVTLKPKRILFTRDSLPPDGVDQTQAKLTFLTGSSGGWFTGNPQWSIIGDSLGCTIDPNTGWIRAGTETGEITVQAEDSNSPYNYLRAALKIGSSGSYGIGAGVLANVGNALAVSLGVLPCDGSFMGSIRLKLTSPSPSLATPAGLTYDQYNTDNALPEILNETLGDTTTPVRQVLAPQGLADIVTISDTEYEIRLYLPEDAGTKVSGYYAPTGTPFKVWRVIGLATDGGGNITQFSITEDPDGANIVNTFTWNSGNNAWTLNGN